MKKIVSFILQIFGICFLALFGIIGYALLSYPNEKTNFSKRDVVFILNWSGLDKDMDIEILQASRIMHPWMDDYEERYCIQTKGISPKSSEYHTWKNESDINPIYKQIRTEAANFADMGTCFEGIHDGNDGSLFVHIRGSRISQGNINGAEVIFYDPASKRLLFYGHQI